MTANWTIEFDGLGVATRTGHVLLRPSSFEIALSGHLGIVGSSGSGKTLLGRAIADVMPPALVRLGQRVILAEAGPDGTRVISQEEVIMIPQSPASALPPAIGCGSLLDRALRWAGEKNPHTRRNRASEILQLVRLSMNEVAPLHASQLSGGMAQRFTLALAIANRAKIIILDEPTVGLDNGAKFAVFETIKVVTRLDVKFIMISHDRSIQGLFDGIIYVNAGAFSLPRDNVY